MVDVVPDHLGPPIAVAGEFAPERRRLLTLLGDLAPDAWHRPTPCPGWTVRDVAAHILGDDLARLSRSRDGDEHGASPTAGESLARFIDRINHEFVGAARRISPRQLCELLEVTGRDIDAFWASVDATALGEPVTWAGPVPAPVWLDGARDLTEYWVHRRQIVEAVGHDDAGALLDVVLDTFLRALPHTLRGVERPPGTTVTVTVPGVGSWSVRRRPSGWTMVPAEASADAVISVPAEVVWRVGVRMLEPADAVGAAVITGDRDLATAALSFVSIIRS